MPKRLSQDKIEFYKANGFLGPVDLLSAEECLEVRRHVEEVEARLGGQIQKRCQIKAHLPFPFLCDLVSHPKLLDAVEDLIGPDILCWGSSFFQKEASDKTFVSWHQDSTYYGLSSTDVVTAWVALTTSDAGNGAVQVIPGYFPYDGTVVVSYSDLQQLDVICQRLLGGSGRFDP